MWRFIVFKNIQHLKNGILKNIENFKITYLISWIFITAHLTNFDRIVFILKIVQNIYVRD